MNDDWRFNQLPPTEPSDVRPDGFFLIAAVVLVVVGPLIYFGPQLGAVEDWFVAAYGKIESWVAPLRDIVLG